MAKDKKPPKEATNLFSKIIKASVKDDKKSDDSKQKNTDK